MSQTQPFVLIMNVFGIINYFSFKSLVLLDIVQILVVSLRQWYYFQRGHEQLIHPKIHFMHYLSTRTLLFSPSLWPVFSPTSLSLTKERNDRRLA